MQRASQRQLFWARWGVQNGRDACDVGLAQVVEHLVAGVVAGGERDAGTAVAAGAAKVETVDADG